MFTITAQAHPDCDACEACARSAAIHARVTGSVGATYTHASTDANVIDHSAKVTRADFI